MIKVHSSYFTKYLGILGQLDIIQKRTLSEASYTWRFISDTDDVKTILKGKTLLPSIDAVKQKAEQAGLDIQVKIRS